MRYVLVLAVAALTFAAAGTGTASALSNPKSTKLRAISAVELKEFIRTAQGTGYTPATTNVETGIGRMQMQAGRLAPLRSIPTITAIAAGSLVVWKIADSLGVGGFVYRKVSGAPLTGTYTAATGFRWGCIGASPCPASTVSHNTGSLSTGWYFRTDQSSTALWTSNGYPSSGTCWTAAGAAREGCLASQTMIGATWYLNGAQSYYVTRTEVQMRASIGIAPSTATEFATPPAGATTTTAGTNDTTTPTDTELAAALDEIDPVQGTAGTAVEEDTATAILNELDPTWDDEYITLPQPNPNETYSAYVVRLQAGGYIGTATSTVLAAELAGYGPDAVARLTYSTTTGGVTTTTTLDPLRWPATSPLIEKSAALTIRYNPSTAAPAPTEGTGTGGSITLPPTTIPPAVGIDFTPITDLAVNCKFPWGFVCYAVDVTGWFDVPADAPRFAFDVPDVTVVGNTYGGVGSYAVDLNVMDDYMALLRDLISIALWVGAVWVLATRLLGLNVGDPGEAADEGLHV